MEYAKDLKSSGEVTCFDSTPEKCSRCHDTGVAVREDELGQRFGEVCDCARQRNNERRINISGLADAVGRYTFEAYQTPDAKLSRVKEIAQKYCKDTSGAWFFITGSPGSGKSHICVAVCGELLKSTDVRYMMWREDAVKIKAAVTDREAYAAMVEPLKRVSVLYIDDLFKGRVGDADINLAFEIINARYNDSRLKTIISSERTLPELMKLDEALGSRIYERARGYVVGAPGKNWRLRDG